MPIKGSVRKRGDNYYYRISLGKIDGKRYQIERAAGTDEAEAYAKMRKAITQLDRGNNAIFEPSSMSFYDYLRKWMEEYVKSELSEGTYTAYDADIRNHIDPGLGMYKLCQLTPESIDAFMKEKRSKYARQTSNRILAVIRGSLEYACFPLHLLEKNPAEHLHMTVRGRKNQTKRNEVKAFTDEQLKVVLERYSYGHPFWMTIMTMLALGCRSGEARSMYVDDIDTDHCSVRITKNLIDRKKDNVHIGLTKNITSDRVIDYAIGFNDILRKNELWKKENKLRMGQFYEESKFLCTMPGGGPITYNNIRDFNAWCKKEFGADCRLSLTSLRHYHATKLLSAAFP